MTIEEAVKILNRNNNLGSSRWYLSKDGSACAQYLTNYEGVRGPFEAIAIAEAYLKKEKAAPLPGYEVLVTEKQLRALSARMDAAYDHLTSLEKVVDSNSCEFRQRIGHLEYLHNILEKRIRECEKTDVEKGLLSSLRDHGFPPLSNTATGAQPTIPEMIKAVEEKVDKLIGLV
jgi:hypothetical protein